MTFKLDPFLEKDSFWIGDIDSFSCRLINDSRYVWLVVIPTINDVTEIYQLTPPMQRQLADLSAVMGEKLMNMYHGDSFNVAALGNVVRQLHIHHIVRKESDAAWPSPVWGHGSAIPYDDDSARVLVESLRQILSAFKN